MKLTFEKIGALIIIVVAIFYLNSYYHSPNKTVLKEIQGLIAKANEKLPMIVDSEIRMDSITKPKTEIQYHATLINVEKEHTDIKAFKKKIFQDILYNSRKYPGVSVFREKGYAMIIYTYNDKNGKYLFRLIVLPNDYRK